MRINALIFDVDGTLADTEEAHRAAFNRAFEQHQLAWEWSAREYAVSVSVSAGPPRWPVAACRRSRDTTNVGA